MEGLGSFLLFAVFFYLMMRVGCGAHHGHGHGHAKNTDTHQDDTGIDHTDPVCGMPVDPDEGYGRMYQGKLRRFCSRRCLDKFDEAPDSYVGNTEHPNKLEDMR